MKRTKEQVLEDWLDGRPEVVQKIARQVPPWNLYRLKPTGQKAEVSAYAENGTIRATCWRDEPPFIAFPPVEVFGLDPNDFEPIEELKHG